jgi:tRNA pseudouridine38-40 synthase|tara:strand:- start:1607 stop:2380 length:774 start_codon:yes stop_codon:yes gene_type:complete
MTEKIALEIEYEGTKYHGYQYQPSVSTIQGEIENSIKSLTGKFVRVSAAGRTDAGVHATGQVVAFNSSGDVDLKMILNGLNYHLPDDIQVKRTWVTKETFHPRKDAIARVYKYRIINSIFGSPLNRRFETRIKRHLDLSAMELGARMYLGVHDFSLFAGIGNTNILSASREIMKSEIEKTGDKLEYIVEGNAFLPHQVRRMVGALVDLGKGLLSLESLRDLLNNNSNEVAHSLPARGLCLVKVKYPENGYFLDTYPE